MGKTQTNKEKTARELQDTAQNWTNPLAPGPEKTPSPEQQVPAEPAALLLRGAAAEPPPPSAPAAGSALRPSCRPPAPHSPAGRVAGPAAGVVGGEDHAAGAGPPAHGAGRRIPSGDNTEAERGGPATARRGPASWGSAAGQGRVTAALPAARRGRAPPPGPGAPREPCRARCAALRASSRRGCGKPASSGRAAVCVKVALRNPSIKEKSLPFRPRVSCRGRTAAPRGCGAASAARQ